MFTSECQRCTFSLSKWHLLRKINAGKKYHKSKSKSIIFLIWVPLHCLWFVWIESPLVGSLFNFTAEEAPMIFRSVSLCSTFSHPSSLLPPPTITHTHFSTSYYSKPWMQRGRKAKNIIVLFLQFDDNVFLSNHVRLIIRSLCSKVQEEKRLTVRQWKWSCTQNPPWNSKTTFMDAEGNISVNQQSLWNPMLV